MGESDTELVVANVAPSAVRLVHATRHVGVTVYEKTVGKQSVGVVREQLLDDPHAIRWIAVLAFRVKSTKMHTIKQWLKDHRQRIPKNLL